MHNNFLMGVKFGTSWKNFQEFSKTPSWRVFLNPNTTEIFFLKRIEGLTVKPVPPKAELNTKTDLKV